MPTSYYIIILSAVAIAGVHSQFSPEPPDSRVLQCVVNAGVPEGCTTDITTVCFSSNCRATLETIFESCGYELAPGKFLLLCM